jgi:hypothetical protein
MNGLQRLKTLDHVLIDMVDFERKFEHNGLAFQIKDRERPAGR